MSLRAAYALRTTPPPADALDVLAAGEILPAVAASELLRRPAAADPEVEGVLLDLLDAGDRLARMLSLYALSAARGHAAGEALASALDEPDLAEHAAWALARRAPVHAAIPALARIIAHGGFTAMPAQLALERWSAGAGERAGLEIRQALARCSTADGSARLSETLALTNARPPLRVQALRPAGPPRGLRVAQILLRGRVDAGLRVAGCGDGGGVVTLLVQLARALGRREDVEQSLVIARARDVPQAADEPLGPDAAITRLPFGPTEEVPVSAMWEYRVQVEQALATALATSGPIDVAHLRYADAGTFAAARALRRAGVRIVFTLAPDPHALIAEGERMGRLTRDSFAAADADEHNLFRLRLIDDLTSRADQIVTLPRAGGRAELERLVGRPLDPRRTATIPEGISLDPLRRALDTASSPGTEPPSIADDLRWALAGLGASRLGLPLVLSVGRLHPVKGLPRLVEAWAGDPALAARYNLVLVGGDLERPSAEEQAVIAEIDAVAARYPAVRSGLVMLGARPHDDIPHLLAIARHGFRGAVGTAGVYACASAKEEFGVAILEALASGLPVVAPAGGGPDSYLEHDVTGVLVEPGSVGALRAGLHRAARLAGDEERAALAETLVRERFAIEPMAAALAETYRRAV